MTFYILCCENNYFIFEIKINDKNTPQWFLSSGWNNLEHVYLLRGVNLS